MEIARKVSKENGIRNTDFIDKSHAHFVGTQIMSNVNNFSTVT